jgi:SAM-dependent methyltransferase
MTSRLAPDRSGVVTVALRGYRHWRLFIEPERLRMRKAVRDWMRQCAPGSRVLEVGGGTSFVQTVIEREVPGAHYVSGDIAPTNNTTVVLDATALPMADASVDAVLALEVLEHMPRPERMLDEVARVLRVDGLAILTVPFMFGVHDFRDYLRFTPLGFSTLLERHGLELADTRLRGGTFVAATGLVRTLILNAIVGEPKDWRARGTRKKVLWMIATVVLTPWALITWAAMGLDGLLDRESKSPPGYFFLCRKTGYSGDAL